MVDGFTKGSHITEFYAPTKEGKKAISDGEEGYLQHHIIKRIHDTHNTALNKVRDRVRTDGMREFWFLFEDYKFEYTQEPSKSQEMLKFSALPVINNKRMARRDLEKAMRNVWSGFVDIVGDSLDYIVKYEVKVDGTASEIVYHKVNLIQVSAMILVRLFNTTNIVDLFILHKNSVHIIATFAEVLRYILDLHREGLLAEKMETSSYNDKDYHIVNLVNDIRPTKLGTRQEALKYRTEMTRTQFEKNHPLDSDVSEGEAEENCEAEKLVEVEEDDDMDDDVKDVLDFLLD